MDVHSKPSSRDEGRGRRVTASFISLGCEDEREELEGGPLQLQFPLDVSDRGDADLDIEKSGSGLTLPPARPSDDVVILMNESSNNSSRLGRVSATYGTK